MKNQIPKKWRKVKLGEIARVSTGSTDTKDAVASGVYPLFDRSTEVKRSNKFLFDGTAIILPGEGKDFTPRFFIGKFDLHQRAYAIFPTQTRIAPKYLYYSLLKNKRIFAQWAVGSTVRSLRMPIIKSVPVALPSLNEQKCIASILSAFDDKIEVNNKISKTLEEMAQAIFKEWFVNFRFPGHEKVRFVDSELGKIPEGWRYKPLGKVTTNYDRKRVPLSNMERVKRKGSYPYYGATEIMDYIDEYIFNGEYLLIAEDGTVETNKGKAVIQFIEGKFWVNNHAHIIQGTSDAPTFYLYLLFKNISIRPYITGAVQLKLTQDNLNKMPIIIPPTNIMNKLTDIVYPMILRVRKCKEENQKLAALRDLFLPKLMSGEIEV